MINAFGVLCFLSAFLNLLKFLFFVSKREGNTDSQTDKTDRHTSLLKELRENIKSRELDCFPG